MCVQEGSGTMFLPSGDSFSGEWKRGVLAGPVIYAYAANSPWMDPEY